MKGDASKSKPAVDQNETNERLSDTLESISDGFVSLDKDWRYTYVNRRAAEMFNRKPEDLIGKHIWTEFPEGIGQKFYNNYQKALKEQKPVTMEDYYPPWNRWFENRIYPTRDGLSIFFQEITERKRAEELVNGQNRLLEMIASGTRLSEILSALVQFIESQVPEMICTILLLDEDGLHVRHGAAPSLPAGLITAIDGSAIGPKAGSCGTAAYRGESVFVKDIATDPLWDDYRHVFLLRGLRACWSSPIFDEAKRVLGTFAIYYRKPSLPDAFHLRLINIATHIASIAISDSRAEEKLRTREQQLSLIYDTVSDVVFLLELQPDKRFRFVSVNQAFLTATGLKEEQVIGKYVEKVIPPSAHELVFTNYWKAIREKRPVQWEEVSLYPTGTKTAIVRVSPVFNSEGNCINLVGAVHDITEFREAEDALRKSQEELEHVYKMAPVGLAMVDENLRFVRVNEEFSTLSGTNAEQHIGKKVNEIFPKITLDQLAIYEKVLNSGQAVRDIQTRGAAPAQPEVERDWLVSYYPVKSKTEKTRGVGVVVLDITDRAATAVLGQIALDDSDLNKLFHVAGEIIANSMHTELITIFEVLPDGSLGLREATGTMEKASGMAESIKTQAEQTLTRGEPVIVEDRSAALQSTITVLIPGKKGVYGVLGAGAVNIRDFSPAEAHFLQSVANILGAVIERKKLEEQVFQAQKMELIGRLAAGVAHQLNTPLAVIMMRLQMLKNDLASVMATAPVEQLEGILTSAKKMSSIVQDLLNFSRVSKLKREQVQMETVLQQILNFVEVRGRKQKVELHQSFEETPAIQGDKNRLEQAFLNIIMNALDAMPEGGSLTISTRHRRSSGNDYVWIEFRDTGTGIPSEEISRIFDPFYTTKAPGQGTGLGLSVTYEIIRSHDGEIRASSKPHEGTTIEVLLPVQRTS